MGTKESNGNPERKKELNYILLYVASSGNMAGLERGDEFERLIARARGKTDLIKEVEEDGDTVDVLASERGFVVSPSGYMMEFVESRFTHLPIIDIAKMDHRRTYRVTEQAVGSLPAEILSVLESNEFVRIHGYYDSDDGKFQNVGLGWDINDRSPWDLLLDKIEQRGEINPVIDYWAFEFGPDYWTPESIAQKRGVEIDTVRTNIHRVKADLEGGNNSTSGGSDDSNGSVDEGDGDSVPP
jgi:hypothetical protein